MRVIRYGFKLMWQEAPREMRRYGCGAVGSFDPKNAHGGVCWGWPKECQLTSNQAGAILYKIYQRRTMTWPQLKAIRKSLAYAYELTGGETHNGNYKRVGMIWPVMRETECVPVTNSQKPKLIPTVEELKEAFTSPWDPEHPWSLMEFLGGLVCAYDTFVNGLRSNEDMSRVKKSVERSVFPKRC